MRCVSQLDWECLFGRVLAGDAGALVTLRNGAIELVAKVRVPRDSPVPPWLREELAEKAFESAEPHFKELETWKRALAYMGTTMDRLIIRTLSRGQRVPLDDVIRRVTDPRSESWLIDAEIRDFILEIAPTLSQRQYCQLRAIVQSCWGKSEGREILSQNAGICARTWSYDRKKFLEYLRILFGIIVLTIQMIMPYP